MNRVIINLDRLQHNLSVIDRLMKEHGATWTVVTKVLCGHADCIKALNILGVESIGDSRLSNFKDIEKVISNFEAWYLRIPDKSSVEDVVRYTNVSLDSELEIIFQMNEEAKKQDKIHRIIIMIELGDLREGILPGTLMNFYESVFQLSNVDVLGIGANLGCLVGTVPSIDQFMQLILYRELLELKFKHKLPMISAGSSAVLPLVLDSSLPKAINHFRIGEAIFLGSDLINGGTLPDLFNDVVMLEAEIAEMKVKSYFSSAETGISTPFSSSVYNDQSDLAPGQRGFRALVSVGHLDTDVAGLTPLNANYKIAGASSDIIVVNLGSNPEKLQIGDSIKFICNYSALLRLMNGRYLDKVVVPSLEEFQSKMTTDKKSDISPILDEIESNE
jgi:ornithine racemase